MSDQKKKLTVTVTRVRVELEHYVDLFPVTIQNATGVWEHTATSEEDLATYLRGVQAASTMLGVHLSIPETPKEPVKESK